MLLIRLAQAEDARALSILAESTFRATFSTGTTPEDMNAHCAGSYSLDIQAREIADSRLVTSLAEIDGELIGFTQWRADHPIACVSAELPSELSRIYVDARWHGQGVAGQLMENVIARAAADRCDVLWLGVWEHNAKAIAFYRKFGFEIVGDHVFAVGSDMQRDLIMARPMAL